MGDRGIGICFMGNNLDKGHIKNTHASFRKRDDLVYKLNEESKTYFRVSKNVENLNNYQENFIPQFLSFIRDKPFLLLSKFNYIQKELTEFLPKSLRRTLPVPSESFSFLENMEKSLYTNFVPFAEFYLSDNKFLFYDFMIQSPYLKMLDGKFEEMVLVEGAMSFSGLWNGPKKDKVLSNSINKFSSNKNIRDNILRLETEKGPLLFYNYLNPFVKSAKKYIEFKNPLILGKESI